MRAGALAIHVDNEPGQPIAFGVDEPPGGGVDLERAAERQRGTQAVVDPGAFVADFLRTEKPQEI
jgi:hypothetical protein